MDLNNCLVNQDEDCDDYSDGLTNTTDSSLKTSEFYTGRLDLIRLYGVLIV